MVCLVSTQYVKKHSTLFKYFNSLHRKGGSCLLILCRLWASFIMCFHLVAERQTSETGTSRIMTGVTRTWTQSTRHSLQDSHTPVWYPTYCDITYITCHALRRLHTAMENGAQVWTSSTVHDNLSATVHVHDIMSATVHDNLSATVHVHDIMSATVHDNLSATVHVHDIMSATVHVHDIMSATVHVHDIMSATVHDNLSATVHDIMSATVHVHDIMSATVHVHDIMSATVHVHDILSAIVHVHDILSATVHIHDNLSATVHVHDNLSATVHVHDILTTHSMCGWHLFCIKISNYQMCTFLYPTKMLLRNQSNMVYLFVG